MLQKEDERSIIMAARDTKLQELKSHKQGITLLFIIL